MVFYAERIDEKDDCSIRIVGYDVEADSDNELCAVFQLEKDTSLKKIRLLVRYSRDVEKKGLPNDGAFENLEEDVRERFEKAMPKFEEYARLILRFKSTEDIRQPEQPALPLT